jgi:phage terminase Nu1 subunit (DNA packaging protein)
MRGEPTPGKSKDAKRAPARTEVTQKELAAAIKRTPRQVHNLTEKGIFKRHASADDPDQLVYPWPASLHAFIDYAVGMEVDKNKETGEDEADRRKAVADAELKEMKVAQLRAQLLTEEVHRQVVTRMARRIREVIDTFPGKHAAKLPGDAPMNQRVGALRKIAEELLVELRRTSDVEDDDDEEAVA